MSFRGRGGGLRGRHFYGAAKYKPKYQNYQNNDRRYYTSDSDRHRVVQLGDVDSSKTVKLQNYI